MPQTRKPPPPSLARLCDSSEASSLSGHGMAPGLPDLMTISTIEERSTMARRTSDTTLEQPFDQEPIGDSQDGTNSAAPEQTDQPIGDSVDGTDSDTSEQEAQPDQATAVNETNLVRFQEAVEHAVTNAEEGVVDVSDLHHAVEAYVAITGGLKARNAATSWLTERMTAAMREGRTKVGMEKLEFFNKSTAYNELNVAIQAGPQAPTADPRLVLAEQVATLDIARAACIQNAELNTATAGWSPIYDEDQLAEQVTVVLAHLQPAQEGQELPELSDTAKNALAVLQGRGARKSSTKKAGGTKATVTRTYTGARRNVLAHILHVLPQDGSWMSVGEIEKADSPEYGTDHPSGGAINAALFKDRAPKEGLSSKGLVAEFGADGRMGARRA